MSAAVNSPIGPIQPEWDLGDTKHSQNIQQTSHPIRPEGKGILKVSSFILNPCQGKRGDEKPVSCWLQRGWLQDKSRYRINPDGYRINYRINHPQGKSQMSREKESALLVGGCRKKRAYGTKGKVHVKKRSRGEMLTDKCWQTNDFYDHL